MNRSCFRFGKPKPKTEDEPEGAAIVVDPSHTPASETLLNGLVLA